MGDGAQLDTSCHLEEVDYDGRLSHCRFVATKLPPQLEPRAIEAVALLDASTGADPLPAAAFEAEGPPQRGNARWFRASFPPREPHVPWSARLARIILLIGAVVLGVATVGGSVVLLYPAQEGTLTQAFQRGFYERARAPAGMPPSSQPARSFVVGYAIGPALCWVLGCLVGARAIKKRSKGLLALSALLLLGLLPLFAVVASAALHPPFRRYISATRSL